MKLSFSTRGLTGYNWESFQELARDVEFQGIELYDVNDPILSAKGSVFDPAMITATRRKLVESGLTIPCIDTVSDISDPDLANVSVDEIEKAIAIAASLKVENVRVRAKYGDDETVRKVLSSVLRTAEENGVIVLVETCGMYSNTKRLTELLDSFACDNICALWDMHNTFREGGESAEQTITNLGAYVKHVHIKDSTVDEDGKIEYCLVGDGDLPLFEMMYALRSVNYAGFLSLEWDLAWIDDIQDMEMISLHFIHYLSRFDAEYKVAKPFFYNRAKTGRFLWKQHELIEKTFSEVLDAQVEAFPDQLAFKYTTLDYTRTYSQFRDDVDECAAALISMGVKAGSKVAIWTTNVPQWFITFWATTKIGAILVTVNTAYKVHEAEYLLRQSDTHTLVLIESCKDSNYSEIISELCPELKHTKPGEPLHCKRLPFLRNIITVGYRQQGCLTWEEAMARSGMVSRDEVYRMAEKVSIHDVCNMQYTSGTTGFPKGVMLTHYSVVNNGKCIGDRMDLSTADRMMIQVPMFHCFGMVLSMTSSMTHGATLCPIPYFSPKSSLACINEERITCFNGVPTMFIAMMNHEDFAKTDFSYIRTGIMAGAGCPPELMRLATEKMNMKEIISVYGQTESSPGSTMSDVNDPLDDRVETVGHHFPHVEAKIINPETGEDAADNEIGEFVARGYHLMKGYYKMPNATIGTIDRDGWLHSGDLACRNEKGLYVITGRLKDMIIRGGENLYPKEIEEFYLTHPKISDVQVIGVPDKQYGEEAMAWIVLKEGETSSVEEMKEYALSHMARHKCPRYIYFTDTFPMNAAGKVQKFKMREAALEILGLK